jgi:hypothetical protein
MPALPWIPQFVINLIDPSFPYPTIGGTETYAFSYPVSRWLPGQRTIGLTMKDATGLPGTTVQNRRYTLGLNLRFHESEWSMVHTFLTRAQGRDSFTWQPNGIPGTPSAFTVRLESPRVTDPIHPTRDSNYPSVLTLPIILGSDALLDTPYFPVE